MKQQQYVKQTDKTQDASLNKKFESVMNQKSTKLIATDLSHAGHGVSLTPHKNIGARKLNDHLGNPYQLNS